MSIAVASGPTWTAGTPSKVLEGRYVLSTPVPYRNYDIASDGQRFLAIKAPGVDRTGAPPQMVVVQHFDEELRRLVPIK